LWVKLGANPRVEHLKCAPLGKAFVLFANIRLGWKGLSGSNVMEIFKLHPKEVYNIGT
jgi:hypothetical protein